MICPVLNLQWAMVGEKHPCFRATCDGGIGSIARIARIARIDKIARILIKVSPFGTAFHLGGDILLV